MLPVFERLAPPPPENVVAAEIEARTAPGDIVIDLHGRGAWVARSAVNRLRRVYDVESMALTRLQAEMVMRPPDLRHLDAALNALAVQPRGDVGLKQSISDAFTSSCATCGRPVVVQEFLWDADSQAPSRKSYHCDSCGTSSRTGDARSVPVDEDDVDRAREMWRAPSTSREMLRARFPTPEPGHPLPGTLLDLYTPRTLDAIAAIAERLDADLRAAPIQAALRLALAHALVPPSRLTRHLGRPQALRIAAGRLRVTTDRGWRERNPWLLFEEGVRQVRSAIQRLEGAPGGSIQARLGKDLASLVDGSSNVVLQQGNAADPQTAPRLTDRPTLPGRLDARSRIRLVLTQPPTHWSPENLAVAYLASSIVLGREAAKSLPTDAIFGAPSGGEWSWSVAALRRSLAGVRSVLASDGEVVLLLDRTGPSGLASAVLGGVGSGLRLNAAVLAESGDEIAGTLEFVAPDRVRETGGATDAAGLPIAVSDAEAPFQLSAVERAVSDVAVSVLQARGEPARFERLLGEVLIGLDRLGHLRRLVGTRTFTETEERAERAAEAVGLFGERHLTRTTAPVTGGNGSGNGSGSWSGAALRSLREPGAHVRGATVTPANAPGKAATDGPTDAATGEPGGDRPIDEASPPAAGSGEGTDRPESGTARPSDTDLSAGEPLADRERAGSGSDPVKLLLEIVLGELRRPDHPRLEELEPGRWWLRDHADIAAARLPISDRLEWAVFSLLSTSGGLSEAAFFDRIAGMFRGHDTPDEELVRACLDSYATVDRDPGMVRTEDQLQARYEEHGLLVGMLAEYGHRLGMRAWISRREQKRIFKDAPLASLLSEAEQRVYLPLVCGGEAEALESVDCIWYVRGKAAFLFEVEWTAMLAEPILRRGSRIPPNEKLVRFLVVPPERAELVRLKLARSPLLRKAVEEGNWHILKSDHLRRLYARDVAGLDDLGPFLGLDPEIEHSGEQLALFA
jgi:hypothetical protein